MWRPTRVEPVNETMSTRSLRTIASPTSGPSPTTMLTTPGGTPASSSSSPSSSAVPDVSSLGFTIAQHPTARANGSFWLTISSG